MRHSNLISLGILAAALATGCGPAGRSRWIAKARAAPFVAGQGEELVTATGAAPGSGPEALWQASNMAKRRAVTDVLSRAVPLEPDNALTMATRGRILDRWVDYVRPGVKVVSKIVPKDDSKETSVTLRVVVMSDALRKDAARLRGELDPSRKPRVIVVMCPALAGGKTAPARAAARAVEEAFASRGFRFVPEVEPKVRDAIVSALRSDDMRALSRAARSVGAEIALVGFAQRSREREGEIYGHKVVIYVPAVTLKAIHTATAKTIFSRKLLGEESVGEAALSNATNDLAESCLVAVLEDHPRVARTFATVVVRIDGISFENFAVFVRQARLVPGVAFVRAKPFAEESGEVEISHARDPVDLARDLVRLKGLSLGLVNAGAGDIRIKSTEKP